MSKGVSLIVFLASGAALVVISTSAQCAEKQPAPSPQQIAQAMLDAQREINGVPGLSASVWHDGSLIWSGTSGYRDLERKLPVSRDTWFRFASVSKVLTTTALAQLAEQGKINLDGAITAQAPGLAEQWQPITPRQLAAHISGLPHYRDGDERLGERIYATGRDAVAIFAGRKLLCDPGERYSYSSWGYTLLGALIEAKTGRFFPDYISRVTVPGLAIGQDGTGRLPQASKAYVRRDEAFVEAPAMSMSYTWGGGGLGGTADALAEFGGRLLDGKILRPATREAMFVPAVLADGKPVSERNYRVGLGWRIGEDHDGAPIVHHSGINVGARSALVLWRQERTAVSLLSNAEWVARMENTAVMLAAPFRPAPAGLNAAPCPVGQWRYSGTFGKSAVTGKARFELRQGLCRGQLEQDGALSSYFGTTTLQRTDAPLEVIGLSANGALSRAALITPFGIADLRANATGGFETGTSAPFTLSFSLASTAE